MAEKKVGGQSNEIEIVADTHEGCRITTPAQAIPSRLSSLRESCNAAPGALPGATPVHNNSQLLIRLACNDFHGRYDEAFLELF